MHFVLHSRVLFSMAVPLTAVLSDFLFGDPPTTVHPVGFQGRYISFLWKYRPENKPGALLLYGVFIILSGLLLTVAAVILFQRGISILSGLSGDPFAFFINVLLTAGLLKGSFSLRNLFRAGKEVASALEDGLLEDARRLVAYHLVSRRTDNLDSSGVASAALESLAENFTDSAVAPFFWYSLGGPAASWGYRYVNTADAMLGYREGDREWGGKTAARLDDILNWIPSRLAGWLIIAAAFPAGLDAGGALKVMRKDSRNCPSPNSGWSMAAAAGALGVRFEKEGVYIINSAGRAPEGKDLKRLNHLLLWSLLFTLPPVLISAAGMVVLRISFF